jgi:hypothetical protein
LASKSSPFLYHPMSFHTRLGLLAAYFMSLSYSAYSSILKMGALFSPETSVYFHQTTQLYTPKDRIIHNRRSEKLLYKTLHKLALIISCGQFTSLCRQISVLYSFKIGAMVGM